MNRNSTRPTVHVVGQVEHPDFRDAVELVRAEAELVDAQARVSPELILITQSRPGAVGYDVVDRLRRQAPLAGMVAVLGSWCEGESRTGRPWPGMSRLYWHEFSAWWRRQTMLHAAGRCPDWARPGDSGLAIAPIRARSHGVVMLNVPRRDTREALSDVLQDAGYATVWHRIGWPDCEVHGAAAGIWDGGQLDEREADDLAMFCRKMSRDAAPVIAMLDFPRRDRGQLAMEIGAAVVIGKPWRNEALLATLQAVIADAQLRRAA